MTSKLIYFDNAATTFIKPPTVSKAVYDAINNCGSPDRGAYSVALSASRVILQARDSAAKLFKVDNPSNIIFTSGATESLNTAIFGLIPPNSHVITTVAEHNSVLRPLYSLNCELSFIPCNEKGVLETDKAAELLTPKTAAVVASHISNVTGNVTDIDYLSRFARENGLALILDCAQSAGVMHFDPQCADAICFTGHKSLFGPHGTGGLIVNNDIKPRKYGGAGHHSFDKGQPSELPYRLEAGTPNVCGIAGLLAGIDFIEDVTIDQIYRKETALIDRFLNGLETLKNVTVYGDFSGIHGGVVSISINGYDSGEVTETLAANFNIATRSGIHCAPLMHKALKTENTGLTRFSFSYFNTEADIDAALNALSTF